MARCFCGHAYADHFRKPRLGGAFCWVNVKRQDGTGPCPCEDYVSVADKLRQARRT